MGPEEESIWDVEDRIFQIEERRHKALSDASARIMQEFEPELREARNDLVAAIRRKAFSDAIDAAFKYTMEKLKKN